jgi:hypothetical protein
LQGRYFKKETDCHHTSTKFQLGVIRWVHEICKWPSYIYICCTMCFFRILIFAVNILCHFHHLLNFPRMMLIYYDISYCIITYIKNM